MRTHIPFPLPNGIVALGHGLHEMCKAFPCLRCGSTIMNLLSSFYTFECKQITPFWHDMLFALLHLDVVKMMFSGVLTSKGFT